MTRQQYTPNSGTYVAPDPTTTLTRDTAGRIATVTEDGVVTTLTRDGRGRIATISVGGVTKTVSRDSAGRIAGVA